ncbi:alkaline shock response membrane anchor protein AmaP [Actinomadura kijaniata]|uniref:alkaline shock response membrane anchor protein AmaP n=1 Tax=Actinomadura kijaniata TaxID=46161 RepID=UPI003F1C17EB
MDRRASRLNHVGLTLVGLSLVAAGGLALLRGLGVWGRPRATEPVLTGQVRRYAAEHAWFWPVVAGVAVVLALLGLYWLLAQLRSHRLHGNLTMEPDADEGETRLASKAVAEALESDVAAFPGVQGAKARLMGPRRHPRVQLDVSYDRGADTMALRDDIRDRAIPRLRAALGVDQVPAVVRLHLVRGGEPAEERRTVR